jgi:TrkA domain protein
MEIERTTVPGTGVLHHCCTRSGIELGVLADHTGRRQFVVYDGDDRDVPLRVIVLDPDEADQLAEILHSRPILDRLADIERRLRALPLSRRT